MSAWARRVACLVLAVAAHGRAQPPPSPPVRVRPGADLAALVDRSPVNTRFILEAGVYRLASLTPKDGQIFDGEPGAILNGARLLSGFVPEGRWWWAPAPSPATLPGEPSIYGVCLPDRPLCGRADEVFFDGVALRPAASLAETGPGGYFYDAVRARVYVAADPARASVEFASAPFAFNGLASRVVIRGLVIEKYGNRAQTGAILGHEGRAWIIDNNIVRWNHGVGIAGGPGCIVRFNRVLENGQLGVSADGAGGVIEANEIARNNTRGFAPEWEAGGGKFAETAGLAVRSNFVHGNAGFGLWSDLDSRDTVYEGNVVIDNSHGGIVVSSSQGGSIRRNYAAQNGKAKDTWLWGGQIMLIAASNWDVRRNTVYAGREGGNGITLIDQDRGAGPSGPRRLADIEVEENAIAYFGSGGAGGASGDGARFTPDASIRFDRNVYIAPGASPRWYWGSLRTWEEFRGGAGQETGGRLLQPPLSPQ